MTCLHKSNVLTNRFRRALGVMVGVVALQATSGASTFNFSTDPFAGSTALTTPGRQVVQAEPTLVFSPATDVFNFDPQVFNAYGVGSLNFASGSVSGLPSSGANVIALQSLDDDNNPATPFGAGNAATLISSRVTAPGAGFYLYFNSTLQLDRLVFSTNLADPNADLAVLARLGNLSGPTGINALSTFSSANFTQVATPEPSSLFLMGTAGACFAFGCIGRRRRRNAAELQG